MMIYLLIALFLVSIPFETFLPWVLYQIRQIDAKLIKERSPIFMSKEPFLIGLFPIINFLKGYLSLLLSNSLFYSDYVNLLTVAVVLILNNWCIWTKFKNRKNFWFILLGFYTFMNPVLAITFAVAYFLMSICLNSFLLGLLTGIFLILLPMAAMDSSPVFLFINLTAFCIVLFAYFDELFMHLERKTHTIRHSFLKR